MKSTRFPPGRLMAAAALITATSALPAAADAAQPGRWGAGSVTLVDASAVTTSRPRAHRTPTSSPPIAAFATSEPLIVDVIGGSFSVTPATITVVLHRKASGNHFVGAYGPVTVVDARGTLTGWTATLTLLGKAPRGALVVHPDAPTCISGNANEVDAGHSAPFRGAGVVIMRAPAGGGGGTFSDAGVVDLDGGPHGGPDTMSIAFAVTAS